MRDQDAFIPSAVAALAFERLVFTGFMGSGKTTLGRLVADRLGWQFLDLDTAIERLAGRSVPAIFRDLGEPEFRRLETSALAEALRASGLVLALGGGVPESAPNRDLLSRAPSTAILYLAAPLSTLLHRCDEQAQDPAATARPVLANRAEAEARFARRETLYAALATHTIHTGQQSPSESLETILAALRSEPPKVGA